MTQTCMAETGRVVTHARDYHRGDSVVFDVVRRRVEVWQGPSRSRGDAKLAQRAGGVLPEQGGPGENTLAAKRCGNGAGAHAPLVDAQEPSGADGPIHNAALGEPEGSANHDDHRVDGR